MIKRHISTIVATLAASSILVIPKPTHAQFHPNNLDARPQNSILEKINVETAAFRIRASFSDFESALRNFERNRIAAHLPEDSYIITVHLGANHHRNSFTDPLVCDVAYDSKLSRNNKFAQVILADEKGRNKFILYTAQRDVDGTYKTFYGSYQNQFASFVDFEKCLTKYLQQVACKPEVKTDLDNWAFNSDPVFNLLANCTTQAVPDGQCVEFNICGTTRAERLIHQNAAFRPVAEELAMALIGFKTATEKYEQDRQQNNGTADNLSFDIQLSAPNENGLKTPLQLVANYNLANSKDDISRFELHHPQAGNFILFLSKRDKNGNPKAELGKPPNRITTYLSGGYDAKQELTEYLIRLNECDPDAVDILRSKWQDIVIGSLAMLKQTVYVTIDGQPKRKFICVPNGFTLNGTKKFVPFGVVAAPSTPQ